MFGDGSRSSNSFNTLPKRSLSNCLGFDSPADSPTEKKQKITRKHFTQAEDEELKEAVRRVGSLNWKLISRLMTSRDPKQCKDRWTNYLSPTLCKRVWTEEEETNLVEKVQIFGKKWKYLKLFFDGRSEIELKNRYFLLERRFAKEKLRTLRIKYNRMKKMMNEQAITNSQNCQIGCQNRLVIENTWSQTENSSESSNEKDISYFFCFDEIVEEAEKVIPKFDFHEESNLIVDGYLIDDQNY
ncbi:Myb-like DNA-binding domain containing protein [Tritrichomonas foetus]|uniref:Myb-like DNA-binding domain containing protein n=1 Tax=Tritrichomonas foetus TaxID=1144522 RepID=A0A1J4L4T1_9EUKA|nr:Myb-like DNA-binding domain containing protein [Tritrichomonas foetus]|eukprot:OHT16941.1 Myb-like DNA-binding domain containing protein [Tritrichomonas foetus]